MKSLQQQSQNFWVVSKMRFKMKCTVSIIVALSMLAPTFASAHSGGTDSNGCHSGTQAYHCHGSKSDELNWEAMVSSSEMHYQNRFQPKCFHVVCKDWVTKKVILAVYEHSRGLGSNVNKGRMGQVHSMA